MNIPQEKCHEYWNHFIAQAFMQGELPNGVTGPRLRKIKDSIMQDDFFWQDTVARHSGLEWTPMQLEAKAPRIYQHCRGNFWGMIVQNLVEAGVLK